MIFFIWEGYSHSIFQILPIFKQFIFPIGKKYPVQFIFVSDEKACLFF